MHTESDLDNKIGFVLKGRTKMKRQNSLDTSKCFVGLNYGEHGVDESAIIEELDRLIAGSADLFVVRCHPEHPFSDET